MKRIRAVLVLLISSILLWLVPLAAEAKTYYWNNTHIQRGSAKLKYCDGQISVLHVGNRTTKNVCALWLPVDGYYYAYVEETGTLLFEICNTGDAHWLKFTSKTDTSRTAKLYSFNHFHCA